MEQERLHSETVELRRGTLRLARRLRAERPADALSANKIGVLAHLHHNGPTTPGDLATAEHQQPQSLTRVFAELEDAGLITRSPSRTDRRQSLLAITFEGERALADDMAVRDAWLVAAMAGLTDAERRLLAIAGALMNDLAATPA